MATASEVLEMLIPNGGWISTGQDYEGVQFLECEPISKKEFQDGFAAVDAWKIEKQNQEAAKKAALLEKLGITEDEAKLLLS